MCHVVWAKLSIFSDNYGNFNSCFHIFPGGIFLGGKVFPDVIFCKESVTVDLLPFE